MRVGFIGLGHMGAAMAANLVAGGEHLDWAALGGLATQDAGASPR